MREVKILEIRILKFTFNCSRLTKIFGSSRLTKAKVKANQRKEKGKDNQELNAFGGASGLVLVAPSLVEPGGTAEPTQIHSEADEGAKGVMMVDSPPHQPHTKKSSHYPS